MYKNKPVKLSPLLVYGLILGWLASGCNQAPALGPAGAEPALSAASKAPPPQAVDLNVFAAASLTGAFNEIGKLFEAAHPGATVIFNFAGSQQLAQQIIEGAPADVFASANLKQMQAVIEEGEVASGSEQVFARNRLVIIFPKDNPAGLTEMKDLANPGLKLVLAAKEVPVGQYSLDILDQAAADPIFGAGFKDDVLANVVSYEDNVKAVLAKVALGEADAGIVYTSDVTGNDADKVGQVEIPDALNVIASYPIAPVKESRRPELAQSFIDLALAPQGQAILAKYGFIPQSSP